MHTETQRGDHHQNACLPAGPGLPADPGSGFWRSEYLKELGVWILCAVLMAGCAEKKPGAAGAAKSGSETAPAKILPARPLSGNIARDAKIIPDGVWKNADGTVIKMNPRPIPDDLWNDLMQELGKRFVKVYGGWVTRDSSTNEVTVLEDSLGICAVGSPKYTDNQPAVMPAYPELGEAVAPWLIVISADVGAKGRDEKNAVNGELELTTSVRRPFLVVRAERLYGKWAIDCRPEPAQQENLTALLAREGMTPVRCDEIDADSFKSRMCRRPVFPSEMKRMGP